MPVALVFPLLLYAYDVKDKDDLQPTDSLLHDTGASQLSVKQLIVPASLVAYGIFEAAMMHGNRMLNYSIGHEVITHKPAKFRIDDYTQYVPAASVYVLNLAGGKGRHGFKDRTVILVMASLFTAVTVNELKYNTRCASNALTNPGEIHSRRDIQPQPLWERSSCGRNTKTCRLGMASADM